MTSNSPLFGIFVSGLLNLPQPSTAMQRPSRLFAVMAKFPPTLIINSTRDVTMSSAIHSHLELVKAGVDAQLYLWEGLDHAFMHDSRLPESHESYDILVKFFAKHLGRSPRP